MAIIYANSMDHYGAAVATAYVTSSSIRGWTFVPPQLLGDGWTGDPVAATSNMASPQGTLRLEEPVWGARSGDRALIADAFRVSKTSLGGSSYNVQGTEAMRLVLPGAAETTRLIHFAFSCSDLPVLEIAHGMIAQFTNVSGRISFRLAVDTTGRLMILDGTDMVIQASEPTVNGSVTKANVLLRSASPVIQPQTWYYLSMRVSITSAEASTIDVYVGDISAGNLVLSGTNLAIVASGGITGIGFLPASLNAFSTSADATPDTTQRAIRDIVVCNTAGAYNNDLLGQVFVSAQEMRAEDDEGAGWGASPRQKIDSGILNHQTNRTGIRFADAAALTIGAADFTFETFARFDTLPTGSATMTLMSKWREAAGLRSYRLYYDGVSSDLVWSISTDGTNEVEVKRLPWVPVTDHWYHVAVSRASAQTMVFIDGVQLGVPVADANTYFDGTAFLGIGVFFTSENVPDEAGRFNGWMDETRFTVGTARYTSDFTPPTAPFPRGVSDPDWTDVVLLMGYDDTTITDESSYARTATLSTPNVSAQQPEDGATSYLVLNQRPAWDDTFVEAPLLPATGTFTFEALPTATETMTIGSQTYTWVSSLTGANQVLIGATIADCVDNIIAAINGGAGEGTVYGTGTTANTSAGALEFLVPQFTLQALAAGAAGNSIATTETMADGFFSAATLTGGVSIPDPSDFAIERLPLDVTGVLGVQVTARGYKTDAGSASIRFDLVGPSATVDTGTALSIDLNPSWFRQVFEQDPDTLAGLTPSTLNAGRIRLVRTE